MTAGKPPEWMRRPFGRIIATALLASIAACSNASPPSHAPIMPMVVAPEHPAAEVKAPAPAPLPPPPVFAGHVATYRTLSEAEAGLPRLIERFPVLRDEPRRLVEIDLGQQRGKVVRLLVGGFTDRDQTSEFCHKLRAAGAFCAPHDLPTESQRKSGV